MGQHLAGPACRVILRARTRFSQAATHKEAMQKHVCAGLFLHFVGQLKLHASPSAFEHMLKHLKHQFLLGLMDADLLHVCENQVPPATLNDVGAFR